MVKKPTDTGEGNNRKYRKKLEGDEYRRQKAISLSTSRAAQAQNEQVENEEKDETEAV